MSFKINIERRGITEYVNNVPRERFDCEVEIYLETSDSSDYLWSDYFTKEEARDIRKRSILINNVANEFIKHYIDNHLGLDDFGEYEYKDEADFWEDIKKLSVKLREELYNFFGV